MRPLAPLFVQKPLSARLAALALLLLLLPFGALAAYIALVKTPDGGFPVVVIFAEDDLKKCAMVLFAVIALDFTLFFVVFRRVFNKITAITGLVQELSRGNYGASCAASTPDEAGALAEAVNQLSAALKNAEQRRVYKLHAPDALYAPPEGGAAARFATVMVVEVEKWSDKSYLVSGRRMIALLEKYYEIVRDCVRKTGGIIESHNDARISVLFSSHANYSSRGGRSGEQRDSYNCLRCALFIRYAAYQYNRRQKNAALRLKINMGIHSGVVTAGLVAVSGPRELTVTGGNLDIARKMAAAACECNFDILMSGSVYELCSGHILAEKTRLSAAALPDIPDDVYALVNIKNSLRRRQAHPHTVDEVRGIMKWHVIK
jgi:class 3 adenylate cyclase